MTTLFVALSFHRKREWRVGVCVCVCFLETYPNLASFLKYILCDCLETTPLQGWLRSFLGVINDSPIVRKLFVRQQWGTSHILYTWHGSLAGTLFLVSKILLRSLLLFVLISSAMMFRPSTVFWWASHPTVYLVFALKPLDTFGTEKKKKSSQICKQFTEGNGKRFLLRYYSMKCFTFWENDKIISILDSENYGFIVNTCHDTAKCAETRAGFPDIFSPLRWPIEPL